MGLLDKNVKDELLHYGEVFNIWTHLSKAKGCLPKYQLLINHSDDAELSAFIKDMIDNVVIPEIKNMEDILKNNGVEIPPSPQEKPKADYDDIPVGAKFSNQEIATCVHNDIAMNLVVCSQIIGISIREDIGKMFASHHMELVKYGGRLLKLMKEKGWVVNPPLHKNVPKNI